MDKELEKEMQRLKILNDIYKNEDEQMKLEYILLSYNYQVLSNNYTNLSNDYQNVLNEHQELLNRLNKNIGVRIYRKIKKIFKKNKKDVK